MVKLQNISDEDLMQIADFDIEQELKRRGYKFGWHKESPFVGVIYILVNPAFPSMVKLGYADNIEKRVKILNSNSGLPDPYHIFAIYKVKKRLEDLRLHSLIDSLDSSLRHAKNREFYEMSAKKAYGILSAIAQINGDEDNLILNPDSDGFVGSLLEERTEEDKEEKNDKQEKKNTPKKQRLTFSMLGIPVGAVLTFKDDEKISVKVADNTNLVEYNGKTMAYSTAVLAIKRSLGTANKCGAYQGGQYLKYNGKTLCEMRDEIEEKENKDIPEEVEKERATS